MQQKIAFLTCQNRPELLEEGLKLAARLPENIQADVCVWNDTNIDWTQYDCLIFRTVWDYFEYPTEFEAFLAHLEQHNVRTLNPLNIIKRNQHKFYLRDLESQGIDIIPTVFLPKNSGWDLDFLEEKGWEKAVIKPAVSAGSYLTKLFDVATETAEITAEYSAIASERDLLVQAFVPEIQALGELSLLFFNNKFVYSVQKLPKNGDFRVQSQFGGLYSRFEASAELIVQAEKIVKTFSNDLLYARVDGVMQNNRFLLMELELIEPDLYFNYHEKGEDMFINALVEKLNNL